jgi:hypothetical protein
MHQATLRGERADTGAVIKKYLHDKQERHRDSSCNPPAWAEHLDLPSRHRSLARHRRTRRIPSNTLPGFNERLTAWLPGLIEHRCGVGERGGFLERLRDGTWAGHILEHVVLELQNLAGMKTGFGKTRSTGDPASTKWPSARATRSSAAPP